MFRRRPTSTASTDASAHSRRVAAADSVWSAQDRLRSGVAALADAVRWPFERLAYGLQEKLLWPAEDRTETLGASTRRLSFAAVVLLAAGAGVAGLIWAAPDKPNREPAPIAAVAAQVDAPRVAPEQPAPTLHGAPPAFKPAPGEAPELDPAKAIVKSSPQQSSDSAPAGTSAAATTSASSAGAREIDGAPAGPQAIAVARDFAGAFVLYETGGVDSGVRQTFGETATPELARALLKRPPRLPANVEVPKAKVVNVVPAPSHGDVYPVSVSLLRVGLTSELRLDMEQLKGEEWRVTNVLG